MLVLSHSGARVTPLLKTTYEYVHTSLCMFSNKCSSLARCGGLPIAVESGDIPSLLDLYGAYSVEKNVSVITCANYYVHTCISSSHFHIRPHVIRILLGLYCR